MNETEIPTLRQLELMEVKGLALIGPTFKETLAYVQIQRLKKMRKELQSLEEDK